MRRLLLLLCLLALPFGALAREVPKPTGYVNDLAGVLSSATERKLEGFLRDFERSDSTQLAVLTIDSLEGEAIEEYSLKVAESWGIGQKGRDNGALLLIAVQDRRMRIEVGYGLEGRLTDLLAGRIIDYEIKPRFKDGDYDGGVIAGVEAMAAAVRGEYQGSGRSGRRDSNPLGALALLLFFGPGLLMLRARRQGHRSRRGGFWVGGGPFIGGGGGRGFGGGGGFSGGGGGFGGGGSSGSW